MPSHGAIVDYSVPGKAMRPSKNSTVKKKVGVLCIHRT